MPASQARSVLYAGCRCLRKNTSAGLVGGDLIYCSDLELRPRGDADLQLKDIICKVRLQFSRLTEFYSLASPNNFQV